MLSRSWPSHESAPCEESQSKELRRGGPSVGGLRNGHSMFCDRTQELISSAELALKQLSSDSKLTEASTFITLGLMSPGADPKWCEWPWLPGLWYCLGTCPWSVSIRRVSGKKRCCSFLRSWTTFSSEFKINVCPSLILPAFTGHHKKNQHLTRKNNESSHSYFDVLVLCACKWCPTKTL